MTHITKPQFQPHMHACPTRQGCSTVYAAAHESSQSRLLSARIAAVPAVHFVVPAVNCCNDCSALLIDAQTCALHEDNDYDMLENIQSIHKYMYLHGQINVTRFTDTKASEAAKPLFIRSLV